MKTYVRQLDEQFESFLRRVTIQTKETDLTEEKRAERRARCDNDSLEFAKEYWPEIFYSPFNKLHLHIASLVTGKHGVSGARNFGKTTLDIFGDSVRRIAKGGIGLIGLAMRDEEDAKERTAVIVRKMRANKKLCYDYSIRFQQMKKGHYIINDKTFVALGMRQGLRNWFDENMQRFEKITCDDLFNAQTVSSEKDNEKVYRFVTQECFGQLKDEGLLIWYFNIIAANSPGHKWAKERKDNYYNLPAFDETGNTNWPGSKWTNEALSQQKKDLPYDVWMGDWMCEAFIYGEIFKEEWIRTVNINNVNIICSIAAVDPSYGKSPSACKKGAVIMGMDNKNKFYVLDIYNRLGDYHFLFDWLAFGAINYPAFRAVLWEDDFAQWSLASHYYDDWKIATGKTLPIMPFRSSQSSTQFYGPDKTGRIMNLVYPYNSGQILTNEMLQGSEDYKEWKAQYLAFGKSKEKLDAIDAEATAFIMIPGYCQPGIIETLKERVKAVNKEDSWLHGR